MCGLFWGCSVRNLCCGQSGFIRAGREAELGAEGLAGAGGKSCAVSLLNVSDGHLSWKLLLPLLPFLSLSPKPKDCTGSPRRCASKDRRASLGFCTGMAKWLDHISNFTLPFGLLSLRICVLTQSWFMLLKYAALLTPHFEREAVQNRLWKLA